MRTPSSELGCIHHSEEHLAYGDNLRVIIDSKGRVSLDSDTTTYLLRSGIEAVRLLWNAEQRAMVFRPVKLTSDFSYPVVRDRKSRQATFSAQRFFRRVGCRTEQTLILPLKWRERERLLEVALPLGLLSANLNSHRFCKRRAVNQKVARLLQQLHRRYWSE
jgi:hypothetical protein